MKPMCKDRNSQEKSQRDSCVTNAPRNDITKTISVNTSIMKQSQSSFSSPAITVRWERAVDMVKVLMLCSR